MDIPQSYQKEQFLSEAVGNNAFDYEERSAENPDPYLRIAPLQFFSNVNLALDNLAYGVTPAFSVFENGRTLSFPGLRLFLLFPNRTNQAPIFVFDNHNHAFFFWHWYTTQNQLEGNFTLIHIDQHKDTRIPATLITPAETNIEDELLRYTNEILNVGNFIPPAIKTGLLGEVKIVNSSGTLEDLIKQPLPERYILDLDLDFFSPDLDYIDNQLKVKAIQKTLTRASIVTIATSPYFINPDLAFRYLKKIFL